MLCEPEPVMEKLIVFIYYVNMAQDRAFFRSKMAFFRTEQCHPSGIEETFKSVTPHIAAQDVHSYLLHHSPQVCIVSPRI